MEKWSWIRISLWNIWKILVGQSSHLWKFRRTWKFSTYAHYQSPGLNVYVVVIIIYIEIYYLFNYYSSCWFQFPQSNFICSPGRDENKKCLKFHHLDQLCLHIVNLPIGWSQDHIHATNPTSTLKAVPGDWNLVPKNSSWFIWYGYVIMSFTYIYWALLHLSL